MQAGSRPLESKQLLGLKVLMVQLFLQVDASPDRPAPGELKEKSTPAPKSGGTPIEGMIMGANANSYLRRGATFDVMKNVEAGVEDAGWCREPSCLPSHDIIHVLLGSAAWISCSAEYVDVSADAKAL